MVTGPIHAYGEIGASYNVANLSQSEMCRYTRIGVNTRFADYSAHASSNATDQPPDLITQENITYQQYTTMQGDGVVQRSDGMKNRRIITVPIVTNTSYNTTNRTVVANRLAAFFIKRKVSAANCTLEVEYVGAPLAVPVGTYTPGDPQMSELTIPVLYK